ncbi:MAG: glucose 1-dehydrogenase [Novosphingobium sp.]
MTRLQGKIALVTGAGSVPGLGSATAIRFAQEGAKVFVTDRDGESVERLAAEIRASGGSAQAMRHDVTSESDWDAVMAWIAADGASLDILVNNAGIAVLRPIEALTTADWVLQTDVNLTSVFQGTRRAIAMMRAAGKGGSIINISSVVGQVGVPFCAAYGASKGGVRLFSKSVALECAREGIRVNSVHPGLIHTNILPAAQVDNAENYEATVAGIPMGRLGDPVDIANMNLFLASDEARYITGAEFVVDGGMTAH